MDGRPALRTKASVSYEHPAKIPQNNCGVCVHFDGPHNCDKVVPPVSHEDWCKLWKHK